MDPVLRGQLRRREDPCNRPAAYRLITGFTPGKITNRGIAALLGVSHTTVNRVRGQAGIAPAEGRTRSADGKLRHVDTVSMSSEERRKKIVELSEEGAKQTDIADMLDVSQSTVSETCARTRCVASAKDLRTAGRRQHRIRSASDDQPLDLDMGNADAKIRSYIDAFGVTVTQRTTASKASYASLRAITGSRVPASWTRSSATTLR